MLKEFTKSDLDFYMNELAKEFKKLTHRKSNAEITLVGGASVLLNYDFRSITTYFDAYIQAPSAMKDAMSIVRDRYDLPNGWLNDDFKKTKSYTPKLREYSRYYRTFANVLTVRTISEEYLVAMKLRSGRKYKHDLSDIVGILINHQKHGHPISFDRIKTAYEQLYDDWSNLPDDLQTFVAQMTECDILQNRYKEISEKEVALKSIVIDFENQYPDALSRQNEDQIISLLEQKIKSTQHEEIIDVE